MILVSYWPVDTHCSATSVPQVGSTLDAPSCCGPRSAVSLPVAGAVLGKGQRPDVRPAAEARQVARAAGLTSRIDRPMRVEG